MPYPDYKPQSSEWVGEIGERLEITGLITLCKHYRRESYDPAKGYEHSFVIGVLGDDGNEYILFTAAAFPAKGERVTFRATVAKHNTFMGRRQTVVKRPLKIRGA